MLKPGGRRFSRLAAESGASEEVEEAIRRLEALAYVGGSQPPRDATGVVFSLEDEVQPGLNLILDGHKSWAGLMSSEGEFLHRWQIDFDQAFPDNEIPHGESGTGFFRRAALGEDGSLLAIYEGRGLVKIDRESNRVWGYAGAAHHDLEIQPDGRIYLLTRVAELVPRISTRSPLLHDFVVVLDAEGRELRRVSILDSLERSPYISLIEQSKKAGDLLHTNTLEVLQDDLSHLNPAFKKGRVLLSLREVNAVVLLDMEEESVVWALAGLFKAQHQPVLLENGHLLLFDNKGLDQQSRVLEIDVRSSLVTWSWTADGFYSESCGSSQRLANGNTLITESDAGRALEVRHDGQIVWEYVTPHRYGKDDEFIATLLEVVRLPMEATAWLESGPRLER